jgi:DUF4097 and DUF4098 domain-containing protein YvlB
LLGASLMAIAAGAPACVVSVDHEGVIEREEKRFSAKDSPEVLLTTFDGAIEVRSWDRPEVLVQIEKRGQDKDVVSKIDVLAEQKNGRISIETRYSGRTSFVGFGVWQSPSAKLIATVPRTANLQVRTADGNITIAKVTGRIDLRSEDGAIRVTETSGELIAETADGSIQLEDVAGRIEARTDDGTVRLSGTPSVVRARSGDGSIVLRIRSGAVMVDDWMVATNDGSVTLELPDGFNAEIEAEPASGSRVRNDLTLASVSGGTREARTFKGTLGTGGKKLVLRSGDGTIRLTNY